MAPCEIKVRASVPRMVKCVCAWGGCSRQKTSNDHAQFVHDQVAAGELFYIFFLGYLDRLNILDWECKWLTLYAGLRKIHHREHNLWALQSS